MMLCLFLSLLISMALPSTSYQEVKDNFATSIPLNTPMGTQATDVTTQRSDGCDSNHVLVELNSVSKCLQCGCAKKQLCTTDGECERCRKGRHGEPGCVYGILSLWNDKVNPREYSHASCKIRVEKMHPEEYFYENVRMSTSHNELEYKPHNISIDSMDNDHIVNAQFTITDIQLNSKIICSYNLYGEDGSSNGALTRATLADLYHPPRLSRLPHILMKPDFLKIDIPAWSAAVGDTGDGPVVRYLLYMCHVETTLSCNVNDTSYTIEYEVKVTPDDSQPVMVLLSPSKYVPGGIYSLMVRAVRPGAFGMGPASETIDVHMPCRDPAAAPVLHRNYSMGVEPSLNKVTVTLWWTLPAPGPPTGCDTITSIGIAFHPIDGVENSETFNLPGDTTQLEVNQLQPYRRYKVKIHYVNREGFRSPESFMTLNRTLALPPRPPVLKEVHLINPPISNLVSNVKSESDAEYKNLFVSWYKPELLSGSYIDYKVTVRDSIGSYNGNCDKSEEKTYCVFSQVKLGLNYTITIQASNEAGEGSTGPPLQYTAQYSAPASVANFHNASRSENMISLRWNEPLNTGGLIVTSFKLLCMKEGGGQSRYTLSSRTLTSVPPPGQDETDGETSQGETGGESSQETGELATTMHMYNITSLSHSTRYNCSLQACNAKGSCSKPSTPLMVYTLPSPGVAPPAPVLKPDRSTATTITLSLTPTDSCTVYRVIVSEKVQEYLTDSDVERSRRAIQPDTDITGSCQQCCANAPRCYIAAEFDYQGLPEDFVVGDNKSYGDYLNRPLVTGHEYEIWYAAGNVADGVARFQFTRLREPAFVQAYVVARDGAMSGPVLAGVITAISLCCIIVVILLVLVIRQRHHKLNSLRSSQERVNEMAENGALIPPMSTYRRAEAVSIDSLDMSKQANGEPVYDNVKLKHFPVLLCELRDYIEQNTTDDGFKKEYNLIPWGLKFSHDDAKLPDNKLKNRYGNIIAYDHSRVVLHGKNLEKDTDYINANYIDGYTTPKQYIATQGPTKLTVNDLWHMIWQENTTIVVMVTNTIELNKHKCEQYWPEQDSTQYNDIKVTLTQCKRLAYYTIRSMTLEKDSESRVLKQFHFTAWPDHGTPTHATQLLSFLKRVRIETDRRETGPVVCHCSAGVGRSGTYMALDSLLRQAEAEGMVDVYGFVSDMRKQRCNMVQTLNQYIFLHEAILEGSDGLFHTSISTLNFKSEVGRLREKSLKGKSEIEQQYEKLDELGHADNCSDAINKENMDKNRTPQSVPLNSRRVHLSNLPSSYINASFIDDHRHRASVIVSQVPLEHTVEHFWAMVHMVRPSAIVTLSQLDRFYPEEVGGVTELPSIAIRLDEEHPLDSLSSCTEHTFTLTSRVPVICETEKEVKVQHVEASFWAADSDLPNDVDLFTKLVVNVERRTRDANGPLLIVCSDSSRQSGVYVCAHSLLQQISVDQAVDIADTVKLARNDQPSFIRGPEQYEFLYEFCEVLLEQFNSDLPIFKCL